MHGLRIEIEAGPAEDLGLVHPLTARERGHADRPGGRRQVLVADDVAEPRVGRVQDVAHGGRDPVLDRCVVAQGEHRRRVVRCQREDPIELRERALGDDPGRDDARGHRLPRDLDRGIQHLGERPEPGFVAIDALGRVGSLEGGDLSEQRAGPVHVVHHLEAVDPLLDPSERALADRAHHVGVGTVRVVERLEVEGAERRQRLARGLCLLGAAGRSDVGESIVVALVPDEGPHQRVPLEEPFPIAVNEVSDLFAGHHGRPLSRFTRGPGYPRRRPGWRRPRGSRRGRSTGTRPPDRSPRDRRDVPRARAPRRDRWHGAPDTERSA